MNRKQYVYGSAAMALVASAGAAYANRDELSQFREDTLPF